MIVMSDAAGKSDDTRMTKKTRGADDDRDHEMMMVIAKILGIMTRMLSRGSRDRDASWTPKQAFIVRSVLAGRAFANSTHLSEHAAPFKLSMGMLSNFTATASMVAITGVAIMAFHSSSTIFLKRFSMELRN